jgi:hypothetical protein
MTSPGMTNPGMTDAVQPGSVQPAQGEPGQGEPGQGEPGQGEPDWQALPGGAGRPDERRSLYIPVRCRQCGATVLAAKFSVQHTSVQWDAAAVARCAEFAAKKAVGEKTPLIERCGAMRASIEAAALDGRLPVSPP